VRRLALLIAAGSLWLFLAAVPALADGGPHVASANSGSTTLTADGCAGCHRAHTAQGEALLTATDANSLCLSCHNATANGATTDVMTGVQYVPSANGTRTGTVLGYLRDGGFSSAHLGSADGELVRVGYNRAANTVSFRMKVPAVAAGRATTSAHLNLIGNAAVTGPTVIWGNGLDTSTASTASIDCTSCHNPHGNGQYRILSTLNTNSDVVNATAVPITAVYAQTDRFFTSQPSGLIVGDVVTISGVTGVTPAISGQYIIKSIAGNTFTIAAAPTKTSADITGATIDITAGATGLVGATVQRYSAIVDDAPLPTIAGDARNYTIIQTRGTQNAGTGFLLYASQVVSGGYSNTSGDYFHRTVPWNPALVPAEAANNCNTANPPATGTCVTANDAPNGRPATWNGTTVTVAQVAFNDQITAWCATCHTRYYSATNPNPGGELNSSVDLAKAIGSTSGNNITSPAGSANVFGYALGDIVTFSLGAPSNQYYVVSYSTTGSGAAQTSTITVSTTIDGAPIAAPVASGNVTRLYPFSASSWFFPRNSADTLYKYQHQTTTNRACTTCHVAHGTDAAMTGAFSGSLAYPDGTAATAGYNSRLLKIDNRGTCQGCHDPTGTATAGTVLGNGANNVLP